MNKYLWISMILIINLGIATLLFIWYGGLGGIFWIIIMGFLGHVLGRMTGELENE